MMKLEILRSSRLRVTAWSTRMRSIRNATTVSSTSISVQDSLYAQTHTTRDVINFGLGQPSKSLLPLELFHQAAAQRFLPSQDAALLQYGTGKGYFGFRKTLATFLSDAYKCDVDADSLMVTAGNSQAISHAAMVLSQDSKRRAFVEQPTYFLAFDIFRELGLSLDSVRVDSDGLDVDALEQKLRAGDVPSFLYTIPFYHNPTGAVLSADRCKRLVELAHQFDFSIISDEPYNLLGLSGRHHRSLASYDTTGRVVSLGSFSKILAPGLRLGWAQSHPSTIEQLTALGAIRSGGGQNPVTASLVHTRFVSLWTVLDQAQLGPHIAQLTATFARRKSVMCDSLRELCPDCTFHEPEGGYFVWVQVPMDVSVSDLYDEAIANHGVAFTLGSRCALPASIASTGSVPSSAPPTQHIRLSFAFYDENEIREGIQRLADALTAVRTH